MCICIYEVIPNKMANMTNKITRRSFGALALGFLQLPSPWRHAAPQHFRLFLRVCFCDR